MKLFIITLLVGLSAFGRQTDNQTQVKLEKTLITITTKPGYHLNAEAPATATFDNLEALFKPENKTEKARHNFSFSTRRRTLGVVNAEAVEIRK